MKMINNTIRENDITSHIFNNSIGTLWNVIKDTSLVNNLISSLIKNFLSEPVLLNSNTSYESNSVFFFYVSNHYKLLYKVKELIETDYYCKVSFKIYSSINKENPIIKTIHLHPLSPSVTRLILETSSVTSKAKTKESDNINKMEVALNRKIFTYIDNSMSNGDHLKTQVVGMKFKVNVSTFIKVTNNFGRNSFLTNFGYHCKSTPVQSGVSISYSFISKHYLRKGKFNMRLEVDFILVHKRGLTAKINIFDVENSNNEGVSFILLPNRFIIAELTIINHQEIYYSVRHQFQECVDEKTLVFFSENKRVYLSKLKNAVENAAQ